MPQTSLAQVVGCDVGFGTTTLINGEGTEISYRSLVVPCEEALANYSDKSGHYLVGDEAVKICNEQRKSTDMRFFKSEDLRILLMYGLQKLGTKNPKIAIGLPNEYYEDTRKEFKARIQSFREYMQNNDQFNMVAVLRQPQGTVWNNSLVNLDGKKVKAPIDKRVAIIDGGDGTTDISEFYQGLIVEGSDMGRSHGASQIHKQILADLRGKKAIDVTTTVHDIDRDLKAGKTFVGTKEVDPRTLPGFKKGVANYCAEVQDMIGMKWQAFNKIDHFILGGGIVDLIGQDLYVSKLKLPEAKILIPQDPGKAVARGFCQYLKTYLQKKGQL